MRRIAAFGLFLGVLIIVSGTAMGQVPSTPAPVWTKKSVANLTMDLVDSDRTEWFSFGANGVVMASVGSQGMAAGTVFSWKIHDGRLEIYDDSTPPKLFDSLSLVSRDSSKIVVRRKSGATATYKVLK